VSGASGQLNMGCPNGYIAEDVSEGLTNPREFVQTHLPRLGPPRLLSVSVRGEAQTYDQLKCCTLDVVLDARAVRRWRGYYEGHAHASLTTPTSLFGTGRFADALARLDELRHETEFLPAVHPQVEILRARCLIKLGRVFEAHDIFTSGSAEGGARAWLDLGRDLASSFDASGDSTSYRSVMQRTVALASAVDANLCEALRLECAKHELFGANDPQAAAESLAGLRESSDARVGFFARAWGKALELFGSWLPAWSFLSGKDRGDAELVEPADAPLSVSVTPLTHDEKGAEAPSVYTSDLRIRPEILEISRVADATSGRRHSISLTELRQLHSRQYAHFENAEVHRSAGRIGDAIRELEVFFNERPPTLDPNTEEKITRYDQDPAIRKRRIADWILGLHWRTFEREVAVLFTSMGYRAWATSRSGDGGVDVRAFKGNETIVIQCKHWKRQRVDVDTVKALHATRADEGASHAILVTSSELEPGAERWATQHGIEVINGARLVDLFHEYCNPARPHPAAVHPEPERPAPARKEEAQDPARSSRLPYSGLDEKDCSVLELVRKRSRIRNKDVQELLSLSRPASGARLRKLVDSGYLIMHGTKGVAYYTETDRERPTD
jgi:HJR/Mrr/RecB family endonuclease